MAKRRPKSVRQDPLDSKEGNIEAAPTPYTPIPTANHTAAHTHYLPGLSTPEERRRHIARLMARRVAKQPVARESDFADGDDETIEMAPVVGADHRLSSSRTSVRFASNPPEKLPESFPARLRVLRRRLCLTIPALAARCELSTATIEKLENGTRRPLLGTVMALARSLGVSLPELVGGKE